MVQYFLQSSWQKDQRPSLSVWGSDLMKMRFDLPLPSTNDAKKDNAEELMLAGANASLLPVNQE